MPQSASRKFFLRHVLGPFLQLILFLLLFIPFINEILLFIILGAQFVLPIISIVLFIIDFGKNSTGKFIVTLLCTFFSIALGAFCCYFAWISLNLWK